METNPDIDGNLIETISRIADSTERVTEYYKKLIFLIGHYLSNV
jgi:hypothetical protein